MPVHSTEEDTIAILVATDNHVGYAERDQIRSDDSRTTFKEIMALAKERDVDMVLLAGDLFHDNKPSRKSLYNVMEALRTNCLGDRPCELEMLSDGSEVFPGSFDHVNYEDRDINVAIPVFSIHGNHDDPTGDGSFGALDLLHISGLLNYYGKMSEADRIEIKPVLLQKGHTKLALYGMSNVRDERLFRTFKSGNVSFFRPGEQKEDWFNLMSVHQNHHAHTQSGYLPEDFLPGFLDLVVWGHEHECLIEPRYNPEMNFHVMQPGSSVATSLMPGEAVPKHVAIITVTGKDFKVEPILLKTVRPFLMKEIVLAEERALKNIWKKDNNRTEITRHLVGIVEDLIIEATQQWKDAQGPEDEDKACPKPLIRVRVEYSAPDGGRFDCENPQRFSNRFGDRVANVTDVIQFYRKKLTKVRQSREEPEMPEDSVMEQLSLDSVKVEKLVREFLTAQSLSILPQNNFGDAVSQFVDKDDKHSMEMFVNESLSNQLKHLLERGSIDEMEITDAMDQHKTKLEELFAAGHMRKVKISKLQPKPDTWDTDLDGDWEDQPGALVHINSDDDVEEAAEAPAKLTASRGRARARGGRAATTTTRKAAAPKKAIPKPRGRAKKTVVEEAEEEEEEDDDESDIVMVYDHDDEDENENNAIFVKPSKPAAKKLAARPTAKRTASSVTAPVRRAAATPTKQSTLSFSQSQRSTQAKSIPIEISEDEISDDDAFEPPPPTARSRR